jgi:hypothetical protein
VEPKRQLDLSRAFYASFVKLLEAFLEVARRVVLPLRFAVTSN